MPAGRFVMPAHRAKAGMLSWRCALAAGAAILLFAGVLRGEDAGGIVSMRGNAVVTVGGEIRVDYTRRSSRSGGGHADAGSALSDLSVRHANLRVSADVHPNVGAMFKIDLGAGSGRSRDDDGRLEEALLVMRSVGGTGLGLFAGKGRAPYGQDVTLGMLQSYGHATDRADSPEGRVFIIDPPGPAVADPDNPGQTITLSPLRPGQFDRVFMAGASYDWDERWRVEAAVFRTDASEYALRLSDAVRDGGEPSGTGLAGRIWWRPVEELVVELSGMIVRSGDMGRGQSRLDLPAGARAVDAGYAVSLGLDWRRGPWRVFGEYQHGRDWNFSRGHRTDSLQIGAARDFGEGWRLGGMAEGLHIKSGSGVKMVDNYYKLAFNVRYVFSSGLFVLAEYGHEWHRRRRDAGPSGRMRGDFFGMRAGFSF